MQTSIHWVLKFYLLSAKKKVTFARLYCWLIYSGTWTLVGTTVLFQTSEIFFPQGGNSILFKSEIKKTLANNITVGTFVYEARDLETKVSSEAKIITVSKITFLLNCWDGWKKDFLGASEVQRLSLNDNCFYEFYVCS